MNSRHLTNGTILILIGVLFLLQNLGIARVPLGQLLSFWPMLFVIAGLQLLFPRGLLALLPPLVVIFTVVAALAGAQPFWSDHVADRTIEFAHRPHVEQARLHVSGLPLLRLETISLTAAEDMTIRYSFHSNLLPTAHEQLSNSTAVYTVKSDDFRRTFFGSLTLPRMTVALRPALPWELTVETAICTGHLNLTNIQWRKIRLETAISQLTLQLGPEEPQAERKLVVESALNRTVLELPRHAHVRITSHAALHRLSQQGLELRDGAYYNPTADSTHPQTEIVLEGAITLVSVRWI